MVIIVLIRRRRYPRHLTHAYINTKRARNMSYYILCCLHKLRKGIEIKCKKKSRGTSWCVVEGAKWNIRKLLKNWIFCQRSNFFGSQLYGKMCSSGEQIVWAHRCRDSPRCREWCWTGPWAPRTNLERSKHTNLSITLTSTVVQIQAWQR